MLANQESRTLITENLRRFYCKLSNSEVHILRMILLGSHAPGQLSLGRWKNALCQLLGA